MEVVGSQQQYVSLNYLVIFKFQEQGRVLKKKGEERFCSKVIKLVIGDQSALCRACSFVPGLLKNTLKMYLIG